MKTVVGNNEGLRRPYPLPESAGYKSNREFKQGKSCFYDFGAENPVEFSGFIDEEDDSDFIRNVGRMFKF